MATYVSTFLNSRLAKAATVSATVLATTLALTSPSSAVQSRIDLATASTFAVLAGAGITNSGPTTADGTAGSDFGSEPTPVNSAELVSITVGAGATKFDSVVPQIEMAQDDLTAAYLDAASRTPFTPVAGGDITGLNLVPGVYNSASTLELNGTVTLNGGGDPDAVFIFQAGSSLVTSVGSVVALVGDAQACNVFWQVGSSATINGSSDFAGHVLALTSITVGTSATINGSLLARNGSVTLLQNVFHNDVCADSGNGGGDTGGDNSEGLASTGVAGWALPLTAGLATTIVLTAVFVIRRRRLGRHSA
jgi:hypothetical protein